MSSSKLGFAVLLLVGVLNGPALAQWKPTAGGASGDYPGSPVDGTHTGSGYYAMFPGGVNYGLSGTFPNLGGYGYPGYGPGPQFGAHYQISSPGPAAPRKAGSPSATAPKPANGLVDLSKTIRKATKKPIGSGHATNAGRRPFRTHP